jgi:hypothetical protein
MPEISQSSQEKGIPIGMIGPEALLNKMMNVAKSFPSFRPVAAICQDESEAPGLARRLMQDTEVLLLSGPLLHRIVRETVHAHIPVHYVPLTDSAVYRALFRLVRAQGYHNISVDTLSQKMVDKTLKETGELNLTAICYEGVAYPSVEELVSFHQSLFEQEKCAAAMTGVESVFQALFNLGIPTERIVPTDENITVALERALLATETRQSKEAQVVVGLINVDGFGKMVQRRTSEHEVQKMKLDIHRMLLDYVESLDGYLSHLGGDEYLFFTTRGIFERETGGYKSIPLARDAGKLLGLSLSIGIGFGRSANDAGTHARVALRQAKDAGGNACFIVREDRTYIGPLEMAAPVKHNLSLTDAALIKRAEEAGMTAAYLSKLMSNAARFGKTDYQVHELAQALSITARSVHRLVLQWVDQGLVDIVGMEKVPKGRPRQVYRFTFLRDRMG